MKKKLKPNIAFFDSSQGGLTVWESVLNYFPNLNTQYLGDNGRCPYGNKSDQTIIRYTSEAATFFQKRNTQLLVVACGTASSVAVPKLKEMFSFPIVGIVEGLCRFAADLLEDKTQCLAVLGTRFTIRSNRFHEELALYGIKNIWTRACPLFVPLVEEGISHGPIAHATSDMYLWDIPANTKIVMLACTHYPRLALSIAESLEKRLGKTIIYKTIAGDWILKQGKLSTSDPVYLIDSSFSIVSYVGRFLEKNAHEKHFFSHEKNVLCTDCPEQFENIAKLFTKIPLPKVNMITLTSNSF
jgi:glutamate racemase